jgi:hypothetical protein
MLILKTAWGNTRLPGEGRSLDMRILRGLVRYAVGACVVSFAHAAFAETFCGSIPAGSTGWNVPNGATVYVRGPGPINDVLTAVGEYRSHSMLSMGPGGWVTHATSKTPMATGDRSLCGSACINPVDTSFLHNSTPGLEQVTQAAIYTFLYGDGGEEEFIAYQNGVPGGTDWGQQVSSFAWNLGSGYWYQWATSSADSGDGYYFITYNGTQVHYGWNQYMNIQRVNQGVPGLDTGVVCSTSLAMWQHMGASGYGSDVLPRTYGSSLITNAANTLYNSVKNQCEGDNGFFASLGSALQQVGFTGLCGTCGAGCALCWAGIGCGSMNSYDGDPCDEAADQIVNTFATNMASYGDNCHYDNENRWHSVVSSSSAVSASPDDIACWSGNGTGAPCVGAGSSIWGYDVNQTVQWNGGGTIYGCWD